MTKTSNICSAHRASNTSQYWILFQTNSQDN